MPRQLTIKVPIEECQRPRKIYDAEFVQEIFNDLEKKCVGKVTITDNQLLILIDRPGIPSATFKLTPFELWRAVYSAMVEPVKE